MACKWAADPRLPACWVVTSPAVFWGPMGVVCLRGLCKLVVQSARAPERMDVDALQVFVIICVLIAP